MTSNQGTNAMLIGEGYRALYASYLGEDCEWEQGTSGCRVCVLSLSDRAISASVRGVRHVLYGGRKDYQSDSDSNSPGLAAVEGGDQIVS